MSLSRSNAHQRCIDAGKHVCQKASAEFRRTVGGSPFRWMVRGEAIHIARALAALHEEADQRKSVWRSKCCGVDVRNHEGEEGTQWMTCSECKRPCDAMLVGHDWPRRPGTVALHD